MAQAAALRCAAAVREVTLPLGVEGVDRVLQEIPIDRLVPHPENSNYMSAEMVRKLRQHIERTGRYEPLTVRQHPSTEDKYEVLNGHNRLRVLQAIGHDSARCVIWDVDDAQARLYLATLIDIEGCCYQQRQTALRRAPLAACRRPPFEPLSRSLRAPSSGEM